MPGITSAKKKEDKTLVIAYNLLGKQNTRIIDIPYDKFLEAYEKWTEGALIQDAFPRLSVDDREFMITGSTEADWAAMFGDNLDSYSTSVDKTDD